MPRALRHRESVTPLHLRPCEPPQKIRHDAKTLPKPAFLCSDLCSAGIAPETRRR